MSVSLHYGAAAVSSVSCLGGRAVEGRGLHLDSPPPPSTPAAPGASALTVSPGSCTRPLSAWSSSPYRQQPGSCLPPDSLPPLSWSPAHAIGEVGSDIELRRQSFQPSSD